MLHNGLIIFGSRGKREVVPVESHKGGVFIGGDATNNHIQEIKVVLPGEGIEQFAGKYGIFMGTSLAFEVDFNLLREMDNQELLLNAFLITVYGGYFYGGNLQRAYLLYFPEENSIGYVNVTVSDFDFFETNPVLLDLLDFCSENFINFPREQFLEYSSMHTLTNVYALLHSLRSLNNKERSFPQRCRVVSMEEYFLSHITLISLEKEGEDVSGLDGYAPYLVFKI